MAQYLPPTENVPIFDTSLFNHNTTPLTFEDAITKFLTFPTAQGTETLLDVNITGTLTANGSAIFNDPIQLEDGTTQLSAYTGAGALAGAYTTTNMTLDSNGKITAISSGNPIPSSILISSTTNSTPLYPVLTNASGSSQSLSVDSTAPTMTYVPSTGTLSTAILNATTSVNYPDSTSQISAYTGGASLAGSYTNTNITVNNQGKITALANGSGGGGGGTNAITAVVNTTDTASTLYPLLSTVGTLQTIYADDVTTPLSYVPFTGTLSSNTITTTNDIVVDGISFGCKNNTSSVIIGINGATGTGFIDNNNVVIGQVNFQNTIAGSTQNTCIGSYTGQSLTSGTGNTNVGLHAGGAVTTGSNNTIIGHHAINEGITTGSNNTSIGADTKSATTALSYSTAIGSGAIVSTNNTVQLGRSTDNVNCPNTLSVTGIITATGGVSGTSTNAINVVNSGLTANTNYPLAYLSSNTAGANVTVSSDTGGNHLLFNPTLNQLSIAGNVNINGSASNLSIGSTGTAISCPSATAISFPSANVTATTINTITLNTGTAAVATNLNIGTGNLLGATIGANNTAIGVGNLTNTLTTNIASNNTMIGSSNMGSLSTGSNNVAVGGACLADLSTGGNNVAIGYQTNQQLTTGSNNVAIGYQAGALYPSGQTVSNSVAIGALANYNAANQIVLGTSAETTIIKGALSVTGIITATGGVVGNASTATSIASGNAGDLLYQSGASATTKLPIGTSSYVLTSNGSIPQWTAPSIVPTPTLANVLLAGNSAGATNLIMNGKNITGCNELDVVDIVATNLIQSFNFVSTDLAEFNSCVIDTTFTSTGDATFNGGVILGASAPLINSSSTANPLVIQSGVGRGITLKTGGVSGISTTLDSTGILTLAQPPVMSGASITSGTIPIASVVGTAVALSGSQTIAGSKTFSSAIIATGGVTGVSSLATSLVGGLGGSIPYQNAVNATSLLANGTVGQVLTSAGTTLAPTWTTPNSTTSTITTTSGATAFNLNMTNGITGNLGIGANAGLTYNPSTAVLTTGALSGNGGTFVIANSGTNAIQITSTGAVTLLTPTTVSNTLTLSNATPSILTSGTGILTINTPVTTGGNVVIGSQTISNITCTPTNISFGTITNLGGNNMTGAAAIQSFAGSDLILRTPAASTNNIKISPLSVDALVVSSAGVATFTNSPILPIIAPTNTANQLGYIQTKISTLTGSIVSGTYQSLVSGGFSLTVGIYSLQFYIQNTITAVAGSVTSMLVGLSTSNTAFTSGSNNYTMGCISIPAIAGFIVGNYHTVFVVSATTTYYLGETLVYTTIVPSHSAAGTSYIQITRIG